jgi:hypothetical protein
MLSISSKTIYSLYAAKYETMFWLNHTIFNNTSTHPTLKMHSKHFSYRSIFGHLFLSIF